VRVKPAIGWGNWLEYVLSPLNGLEVS